MCNIWKKTCGAELTLHELEKFFSHSNKFSWIDISGGEVFLRDDLKDIFELALHNCKDLYLLHFATNGFLTEKIISTTEKILKLKPPKLLATVSLDGHRELHDKIRGIPGAYDMAIKTFSELRKFNSRSFKVFLGMTLTADNYLEFERSSSFFKKDIPGLTYDELHVNIAQSSGHYYDNKGLSLPDPEKLRNILEYVQSKRRHIPFSPVTYLESRYLELAGTYLKTKQCPQPCQALSVSCFLDPEGYVYPCNTYSDIAGNIRDFDYDLEKLLMSEKALKLRRKIKQGLCPQCWTPCEAYQTIIANSLGLRRKYR